MLYAGKLVQLEIDNDTGGNNYVQRTELLGIRGDKSLFKNSGIYLFLLAWKDISNLNFHFSHKTTFFIECIK